LSLKPLSQEAFLIFFSRYIELVIECVYFYLKYVSEIHLFVAPPQILLIYSVVTAL
jgi:hypothetical protein